MAVIRDLVTQARQLSLALVLMCGLMVLLVLGVCVVPPDVLRLLLQDPAVAYGFPGGAGAISYMGVLLFWAGCFSIILGLDDLFLFHELAMPGLGVPELAVLGAYGALLVALVWTYRRTIPATDYLLLVLASAAFCLSIVFDEGPDLGLPLLWRLGHTPLEDVFKLVGIVAWCAYLLQTGFRHATGAGTRGGPASA